MLALGNFSARDLPEKRRLIESILADLAPADAGARPLVPRIGVAYYPDDGAYCWPPRICVSTGRGGAR